MDESKWNPKKLFIESIGTKEKRNMKTRKRENIQQIVKWHT